MELEHTTLCNTHTRNQRDNIRSDFTFGRKRASRKVSVLFFLRSNMHPMAFTQDKGMLVKHETVRMLGWRVVKRVATMLLAGDMK